MKIVELDELPSLKTRLAQLSPETSHSIYRVPRHLRDVSKKAYEPEMVAIGPYYRGKPELKEMEERKLRYMQALVVRKPDVRVEDYISAIKGISKRARDCYAQPPVNLNDNEFTDMLVLDGCFIIEVIRDRELFLRTFPDRSNFGILRRDLILLENQIPFFVLCKLFELVEGPEKHSSLIENYVLIFCHEVFPGGVLYRATTMRRSEEVHHILDLTHSNYCPPYINSCVDDTTSVPVEWCCASTTISSSVIPSASELKDANVKFRIKEYDSPPDIIFREGICTSLFDVEFNDSGKMMMPRLVIDDGTESLLRNLIAYEQLFPDGRPSYIVDYATLLDCLINTSKDVQILCSQKIIENLLGSEQVVADFVNRLGETIMLYEDGFMYEDTFRRINVHHQKCWNRAVAALHRDYFNTPWAYIAFLAALTLLLLAAAQTIYLLCTPAIQIKPFILFPPHQLSFNLHLLRRSTSELLHFVNLGDL